MSGITEERWQCSRAKCVPGAAPAYERYRFVAQDGLVAALGTSDETFPQSLGIQHPSLAKLYTKKRIIFMEELLHFSVDAPI
jgi:hypothetical protein